MSNKTAKAALILSILGGVLDILAIFLTGYIAIGSVVCCILGIIFGCQTKNYPVGKLGMVIGIVSCVFGCITLFLLILFATGAIGSVLPWW